MHISSQPNILYFGTPVALISTSNADATANLAPISSVFWLGWRCVIGVAARSQTSINLLRSGQCVVNLPSCAEVEAVNRLALTTGADPMSDFKAATGYRVVKDKFAHAQLTAHASESVTPPRVKECPVQLEAVLEDSHGLAESDAQIRGHATIFELRVTRVHLHPAIVMQGKPNQVDPQRWRPLIMSFQKFYGLQGHELHASALSTIPERAYRSPDIDRAVVA